MNPRNLMSPIFRHNDEAIEPFSQRMDSLEYFIRHLERAAASADESIFPHRGGEGEKRLSERSPLPLPCSPWVHYVDSSARG